MNILSSTVTENSTIITIIIIIIFTITHISTNNNNNNNNNRVPKTLLIASLTSRCEVSSGRFERDGVQVRRVADNVLNKQQQISDKGCPPVWWLCEMLTS
jgi:hypothetical protein